MKKIFLVGICLWVCALAGAQQKYALVIGNGAYQTIERLANPVNDATDIAARLGRLGYDVTLKTDLKFADMGRQISAYMQKLRTNVNNEGFFWYAGHGVQLDGENYLLPVDVDTTDDAAVIYTSYPLNRLIASFEGTARNKVNIVVLDACRNNPFRNTAGGGKRSVSRGLAVVSVEMPPDLFILFSTKAGQTAADGERGKRNSPFAEAFMKHMDSGDDFAMVSRRITRETMSLTNNIQQPYTEGSIITSDHYSLNPKSGGTPAPAVVQPTPAPVPKPVVVPVPANFVRIPGGTFTMGSPSSEAEREDNEVQHQVTVSSFYMGKYEVTQKEWTEVMGSNPSSCEGDTLPVENVSWYDAIEYCNKRSVKEGLTPAYTIDKSRRDPNNQSDDDDVKWIVTWNQQANGYRLPTEAEWEYACRAGTSTPFSTGNNITTNQANYYGDYPYNGNAPGTFRGETTPVGSFAANAWGLYDMHGNLWEWCWDWYGDYATSAQTDPMGASSGTNRVDRGGGWCGSAGGLRSACRVSCYPTYGSYELGFRLVRP